LIKLILCNTVKLYTGGSLKRNFKNLMGGKKLGDSPKIRKGLGDLPSKDVPHLEVEFYHFMFFNKAWLQVTRVGQL